MTNQIINRQINGNFENIVIKKKSIWDKHLNI